MTANTYVSCSGKSTERFNSTRFREAAGQFASGIVIVTVFCKQSDTVRGMTATSFTSVSLAPPLVLVSLSNTARMLSLVRETGSFGISVLSAKQQNLSRLFAGQATAVRADCFQYFAGIPMVAGALASFACDSHAMIEAGDHTLVLGRVQELEAAAGDPLLYFRSHYRTVRTMDEEFAYASIF